MFGQPFLRRSPLLCVCLALVIAPARGQEAGQRATLRVLLPGDARLVVDGKQTRQTGPVRRFSSPPLDPDKSYHYTLECTYDRGGNSITRKEVVHFRAGDDKKV